MIQSEEDLVKENYGLAISIAKKFYKKNSLYAFEDLVQISLMAMIKAHRQYNSDKSVFSTFATYCMRNDLIKFVKKNRTDLNVDLVNSAVEDKVSVDEITPTNLTTEEAGVFYYKRCGYRDVEIRRILELTPTDLKNITKSCFDKIVRANA
jgi:RNA polymerase sigma factor (sigma-70 family)